MNAKASTTAGAQLVEPAAPAAKVDSQNVLAGWAGMDLLETWMDISSEIATFTANRLHEDVSQLHEIWHCRSPLEFQKIQMRFIQKAVEDYHEEAGRLVEMGRSVPIGRLALD